MAFKDIAGNSRVKKILRLALERKRVPNSLLFTGPEGIGKRRTALTLAKALNCLRLSDDSCDECESCRAIDKDFGLVGNGGEEERGRFPDVIEIAAEKNTIRIDQIRLLRQMSCLRPMAGRHRVFIIEEAEKMGEDAENSLLKVLEEPPPYAHIILLSSNPFRLLPTIRSRCQTLVFTAITREEIERELLAAGYDAEQARVLSLLVDGNLERALDLDWDAVRELKARAWGLFAGLVLEDKPSGFLEMFGGNPRILQEEIRKHLEVFLSLARDLLLLQCGGDATLLLNPDYEPELTEAAGRTGARRSLAVLAEIGSALSALPGNLNKNLLVTTFVSNLGEFRHV
jgi:DNA polymerase-3 subunit delta'